MSEEKVFHLPLAVAGGKRRAVGWKTRKNSEVSGMTDVRAGNACGRNLQKGLPLSTAVVRFSSALTPLPLPTGIVQQCGGSRETLLDTLPYGI